MAKLNRNYLSFYEALRLVKPDPERPESYSYHGFRYHDGSDEYPSYSLRDESNSHIIKVRVYVGYQLLGAFQPLAKMWEDIINTFKPYHSSVKKDFLQPLRGTGNLFKGIGSLAGGSILFAGWLAILPLTLLGACIPYFGPRYVVPFLVKGIYPVSWIIDGITTNIRGATQVLTTPLTYFLRMPLRGLISCFSKKKYAEDKFEIKRLTNEVYEKIEALNTDVKVPSNKKILRARSRDKEEGKKEGEKETEEAKVLEQYHNAKNVIEGCIKNRRDCAALLFEVNRKYNKSIKNGWKSNVKESIPSFSSFFGSFKDAAVAPKNLPNSLKSFPGGPIHEATVYLESINTSLKRDKKR